MKIDVTIDRDKYIGGSDIPIIMGISPFKTRYQLLLEKAGLVENEFTGNRFTQYGDDIEPLIRDYINEKYKTNFAPAKKVKGDLRGHTDGVNKDTVLEIKSTSQIHETVDEYIIYLVQLLFYMNVYGLKKGKLAVYERPEDFNLNFDANWLQEFDIKASDYKELTESIFDEIDRFRVDLQRLKENPLLCEQDFQPKEVVTLSNEVIILEGRMAAFKELEKQYDEMKKALYKAMKDAGVKSWIMPNGTRITMVAETLPSVKTVEEFDVKLLQAEQPELYRAYTKEVIKETNGRAGYVKITPPKVKVITSV